jgi:beta-xylosidase
MFVEQHSQIADGRSKQANGKHLPFAKTFVSMFPSGSKKPFILLFLFFTVLQAFSQNISKAWTANNNNTIYTNPIIHADYSDPDAIRVGNDYYMTASSFNHVPGLPILHSKDLINWKLIGYALNKLVPVDHFSKVQHGGGVSAPSIRFHNNEFHIYYPDPDFGIYLVKAKKITGPWSEPLLVQSGKGLIDPCPFWDDDGRTYLVHAYAGSRAGIKSILAISEMNKEGTMLMGNKVLVYDGHEKDPTIEGPKLYKRNGYYYIFAPAGGVSTGWQTVLRSKNIYGSYERKVVMGQGKTNINGPHQGAWVTTQTGEDWFLHFQDKGVYGRVVHLQPMTWKNNWPVIGNDSDGDGTGEPVERYWAPKTGGKIFFMRPPDSDEFDQPTLGLQWQWQANPGEGWAFPTTTGSLRMFSVYVPDTTKNIWNLPNILAQKLPAEAFRAKVKITVHPKLKQERFGFVVFGTAYRYLCIQKRNDDLFLLLNENEAAEKNMPDKEVQLIPLKGNELMLQVEMDKGGNVYFSYSDDDLLVHTIGNRFTVKPGKWVGAKIGFFCTRNAITNDAGYMDMDWIRFEKIE